MTIKLPHDLQAMKELIEGLGFECKNIRRPDGVAFEVKTDKGPVHVKMAYEFILATDRIPGIPMQSGFGHGDMRFKILT